MIRFIYGNHGYGKTDRILQMIQEDTQNGKHVFLIVPDQEALQAERLTLSALAESSQLELEVLGFSRLYNRVCREYGNICYSYITKPIRYLLMWKALHELKGNLEVLGDVTKKDIALEDMLISSINELKINGISAQMLEESAEKIKSIAPELSAKTADIATVYTMFDEYVNEKFSDSADDLSRLYNVLCEHDFFKGANVYIDSFTSFTPVQHKIIERIFKGADNVVITIPASKACLNEMDAKNIRLTENKFLSSARNVCEPVCEHLEAPKVRKPEALELLSENIWRLDVVASKDDKTKSYDDGSVVLEECDNPYTEAQAVCAHIRRLLSEGARCRDIVIIARDAENYRGIIDQALEKSNIPYYFSNSYDIYSTAALKFIISALRIKLYNWRKADVISYVKSGLCGVKLSDSYLFEEYINTWNINGANAYSEAWAMNPDGFAPEPSLRGKNILAAANRVREAIVPTLEKLFILLDAQNDVGGMCKALYSYVSEAGLEKKLVYASKKCAERGDIKGAQETSRLYSILINSLADIGSALSGEKASVEELLVILKSVFDKTDITTIPTSIDEVTIGSANMLRTSNPKYAFVLGLCEGKFPATVKNDSIFSNADRSILGENGIIFDSNGETRAADELMYVKRSFSAPTERLYAFTHISEINGSKCFKSLAFSRIEALLRIKAHKYVETDFDYLIPSPKNAAMGLRSISDDVTSATLRKALSPYIEGIEARSAQSIKTEECHTTNKIDVKYLSASSFEMYAKCPFNYFCNNRHALNLRDKKTSDFGAANAGSFIHAVLESVIKELVPESKDAPPVTEERLLELTEKTVEKYLNDVCPSQLIISKRLKHLYSKLKKLSLLLARSIIAEFADSDFYPAAFELKVNDKDGAVMPLTFTLTSGTQIRFNGYIDRVDLYKKDSKVYVRVVDYKTGTKDFSLSELQKGLNTQMLIYLYAICKNGKQFIAESTGEECNVLPSGVVYLSSNISTLSKTDYEEENVVIAEAEKKLSRSGIILGDEDILLAMNNSANSKYLLGTKIKASGEITGSSLVSADKFNDIFCELESVIIKIADRIENGDVSARPYSTKDSPCEYCASKPICRNIQR